MKFLFGIVALATAWTAAAQGTSEAIVGHSNPSPVVTTTSGTVGWTFQPAISITVTHLGCFDDLFINTGSINTIWVELWRSDGFLLASNSITRGSVLLNQSRYESILPVPLDPGQVYNIGAYSPDGSFSVEVCGGGAGGSVSVSPEIYLRAAAINTNGFGFPAEVPSTGGSAYLGPNFQYQGRIPEPSSGLLLAFGALLLAFRRRV
jgi:hypothetical protein